MNGGTDSDSCCKQKILAFGGKRNYVNIIFMFFSGSYLEKPAHRD